MQLDRFFDSFELFDNAHNNIPRLRDLILQLAVQGKLVVQDPNDEPASVLLERIKTEKEQLIKDGKIKKPKPLPPIDNSEIPFKSPNGWAIERIGNVIAFEYGDPLKKSDRDNDGRFPVFGSNGIVGHHSKYTVENQSIIIGRKGSAGSVNLSQESCWVTDVAFYVIPPKGVILHYLFIALKSLQLEGLSKGIKPGVNRNEAYRLYLPIPPTNEQHRIVEKVDSLMRLCDELEKKQNTRKATRIALNTAALDSMLSAKSAPVFSKDWHRIRDNFELLYDRPETVIKLRQSILQLAVQGKLVEQDPNDEPASVLLEKMKAEKEQLIKDGKIKKPKPQPPIIKSKIPYELPKEWVWCYIDSFCSVVRGGSPRPAGDPRFYEGNIPFLKVADITKTEDMYLTSHTYTIKEAGLHKTRLVNAGAVMLTNSGATLGVPKICNFETTFNDGVAAFEGLSKDIYKPYLYYFLKSKTKWFLEEASRGQGQPNLNTDIIRLTTFPLPPLAEQHRIVEKVDSLMKLCDDLEAKLKQSQSDSETLMTAMITNILEH